MPAGVRPLALSPVLSPVLPLVPTRVLLVETQAASEMAAHTVSAHHEGMS